MPEANLNPQLLNSWPPMYVDEDGHVHQLHDVPVLSGQIDEDGDAGDTVDPYDGQLDVNLLEEGGRDSIGDDEMMDGEDEEYKEEEIQMDGEALPDPNLAIPLCCRSMNQLTLSFNGEVYIYPSVSPGIEAPTFIYYQSHHMTNFHSHRYSLSSALHFLEPFLRQERKW